MTNINELNNNVNNKFEEDLNFSNTFKNKISKIYSSITNNFIYITNLALQKTGIDVLLFSGQSQITVEEKLQRNKWNSFCFEIQSNSNKGEEKKGWMFTSVCDYLMYSFQLEDGELESYLIDFKKLKKWFIKNYKEYRIVTTNQMNHSKSTIIPISTIEEEVGFTKYITSKDGEITIYENNN